MKRIAIICALVAMGATTAAADYVELVDYNYLGGTSWGWNYRYVRTVFDTNDSEFLETGGTWGLYTPTPTVSVGSPNRWTKDVLPHGPEWTYDGSDLPNPETSYGEFDIVFSQENLHFDDVPYEIDTDGDGTPDTTSTVTAPTPEPGTMALALVGLGAIATRLRRRRDED